MTVPGRRAAVCTCAGSFANPAGIAGQKRIKFARERAIFAQIKTPRDAVHRIGALTRVILARQTNIT